jgi:hypothetical protein
MHNASSSSNESPKTMHNPKASFPGKRSSRRLYATLVSEPSLFVRDFK